MTPVLYGLVLYNQLIITQLAGNFLVEVGSEKYLHRPIDLLFLVGYDMT